MKAALLKIDIGNARENDRSQNRPIRSLLTPRRIASFLVVSGLSWFIYISPKTPIEFFDAHARDEAAIRAMKLEKNKMADPVGAAKSQKMDDLMSCWHRMERIALLHDIANNPQRVNSSKPSIVDGFYHTDESTEAKLRADDENYRANEQELETFRNDIQSDKTEPVVGDVKDTSTELKVVEATISRMQLEAYLLRQFQARLFWRNAR